MDMDVDMQLLSQNFREDLLKIQHHRERLQDELVSLKRKMGEYERDYILPCFKWAKEVGLDLGEAVRKNPGKNCVELLVEWLMAHQNLGCCIFHRSSMKFYASSWPKNDFVPLEYPVRDKYGFEHDMKVGPCSCGAVHKPGDTERNSWEKAVAKGVCGECKGTGEIGLSDDTIPCPKCGGSGNPERPGIFKGRAS